MKLWVARDKDCELYLFTKKPNKIKKVWATGDCTTDCVRIDSDSFPDVQWEDEEPTLLYIDLIK